MRRRYYAVAAVLALAGLAGLARPAALAGWFGATPVSNAVHLGAAVCTAYAATRGLGAMRWWGKVLGLLFVGLAVAAIALDDATVAHLLPLTNSHAWFHLIIGCVFLYHALLAPPRL
jgi:hypothetical protein